MSNSEYIPRMKKPAWLIIIAGLHEMPEDLTERWEVSAAGPELTTTNLTYPGGLDLGGLLGQVRRGGPTCWLQVRALQPTRPHKELHQNQVNPTISRHASIAYGIG